MLLLAYMCNNNFWSSNLTRLSIDISTCALSRRAVSQSSYSVVPQGGRYGLCLSVSLNRSLTYSKTLIHSKRDAIKLAVEVILTLSVTLEERIDAKTEISLSLGMTTYFYKHTWIASYHTSHTLSHSLSVYRKVQI